MEGGKWCSRWFARSMLVPISSMPMFKGKPKIQKIFHFFSVSLIQSGRAPFWLVAHTWLYIYIYIFIYVSVLWDLYMYLSYEIPKHTPVIFHLQRLKSTYFHGCPPDVCFPYMFPIVSWCFMASVAMSEWKTDRSSGGTPTQPFDLIRSSYWK